jgi:hypothetical protein
MLGIYSLLKNTLNNITVKASARKKEFTYINNIIFF